MKTFITNRLGLRLCVVVDEQSGAPVFVSHGLGGNKDELHIQAIAQAFRELDHTVITFDTTNTFGESDGRYEDATLTGYHNDLCDVTDWAARQTWYREPFILAGSSLGGMSSGLYAQNLPHKVSSLALISTLVSGELTLQTPKWTPEVLTEWKRTGILLQQRSNGEEKRLKWACMEDRLSYSLLSKVDRLSMPTLIIVGEKDESAPPQHQQILFDAIPSTKEMHIVRGAGHQFRRPQERIQLQQIIQTWAGKHTTGESPSE